MRKLLSLIVVLSLISALALAGCTADNADALEQQLDEYKEENERLRRENTELTQFKERVDLSLFKLESTIFYLNNEGYLPLTGSQVNAPELYKAMDVIKEMDVQLEDKEIILSMMPQEWSEDFDTILMVYDVYKPMLNGASADAGKAFTMAGIFKKTEDKWELIKFTREFKGDESFSIKNM